MLKKLLFVCLLFVQFIVRAQDTVYARTIIKMLTSKDFKGRGYVKNGVGKAAIFLQAEFTRYRLKSFSGTNYFQSFNSPVNTFPSSMKVVADGKRLIPGIHYIVGPECKGLKGKFNMVKLDSATYTSGKGGMKINLKKKLTWSVSTKQADYTRFEFFKDSFPKGIENIEINLKAKFIKDYNLKNLCGFISGSEQPDSFIVFTAHYDHLGCMGKSTYFPGANDNASGTAMLLNLIKYFSSEENKPKYSIAFISFTGEEAGLLGSEYYVNHPVFPLSKIKFLINLDLLGTGDEGITVVNATEFKKEFETMKEINAKRNYLTMVKPRGKAKNSDHYWFSEKGVPCFFIYTMGGIKAYHDVYDIEQTLPLTKFNEVFKLLVEFTKQTMEH